MGSRDGKQLRSVLLDLLTYARNKDYKGFGKHDALNSPLLKALSLHRKWLRIIIIQAIMRSPVNLRPLFGVRQYRNPKGIALFVRSYLDMYRLEGDDRFLHEALELLAWLEQVAVKGWSGPCWGYFWDWQDLGFFAPSGSPNSVVTSFVGQALLDAWEVTGNEHYLRLARGSLDFLLNDTRILFETETEKCVSYVPSQDITMRVMDVSALIGALAARVNRDLNETRLAGEARRLLAYVVNRQTAEGAWFYTDPPEDSPLVHDNYHTGFILDTLLDFELSTGDTRFRDAYRKGLNFYANRLFLSDGAPKWQSHQEYPLDIHGAATGIGTFSRAAIHFDPMFLRIAQKIAQWTIENMLSPHGFFYYQQSRWWTRKFTLMRWCNAWMAYGLTRLLVANDRLSAPQRTAQ